MSGTVEGFAAWVESARPFDWRERIYLRLFHDVRIAPGALDKMLLQDQPQPSEDTMHDQTGYAQGTGRIADRGPEVGRQARTDETIGNLTSNHQRLCESTGRLAMLAERLIGAIPPRPASSGTGPAKVDREPPKFDVITNIIATEREQLAHLEAVVCHLEQL